MIVWGVTQNFNKNEEVQTFNLFGSDLYENLNEFYEEDDDISNSELKFLKIIRDIRDNNKVYIKDLNAKKSRSSKNLIQKIIH